MDDASRDEVERRIDATEAENRELAEDYQRRLAEHIAQSRGAFHRRRRLGLDGGGPGEARPEQEAE